MYHDENLVPEEQNAQLVQDLRTAYDTHAADQASLARIRTRILLKSSSSLPISEVSHSNQDTVQPDGNSPSLTVIKGRKTHMQTSPHIPHPTPSHRSPGHRPWTRRLTTLVAGLLLVTLIGSLALFLHLHQQTPATKPDTRTPQFTKEWTVVGTVTGIGPKLIEDLHFDPGRKAGIFFSCNKEDELSFHTDARLETDFADTCLPFQQGRIYAPQVAIDPNDIRIQQTLITRISVLPDRQDTSWQIFILKGSYPAPLVIPVSNAETLLFQQTGIGPATVTANFVVPTYPMRIAILCEGSNYFDFNLFENPDEPQFSRVLHQGNICSPNAFSGTGTSTTQASYTIHLVQILTGASNRWTVNITACKDKTANCWPKSTS